MRDQVKAGQKFGSGVMAGLTWLAFLTLFSCPSLAADDFEFTTLPPPARNTPEGWLDRERGAREKNYTDLNALTKETIIKLTLLKTASIEPCIREIKNSTPETGTALCVLGDLGSLSTAAVVAALPAKLTKDDMLMEVFRRMNVNPGNDLAEMCVSSKSTKIQRRNAINTLAFFATNEDDVQGGNLHLLQPHAIDEKYRGPLTTQIAGETDPALKNNLIQIQRYFQPPQDFSIAALVAALSSSKEESTQCAACSVLEVLLPKAGIETKTAAQTTISRMLVGNYNQRAKLAITAAAGTITGKVTPALITSLRAGVNGISMPLRLASLTALSRLALDNQECTPELVDAFLERDATAHWRAEETINALPPARKSHVEKLCKEKRLHG